MNTAHPANASPITSPAPPPGGGGLDVAEEGGGNGALHPPGEILGAHDFRFSERLLAQATGVHLRLFARARVKKFRQDHDWALVQGEPCYAETTLVPLLALLGLSLTPADLPALLEKMRPAPPEAPVETARVTRFYPNAHMLQIQFADRRTADLFVARRQNFKKGMAVPVRSDAGKYQLARPLPRHPGRW